MKPDALASLVALAVLRKARDEAAVARALADKGKVAAARKTLGDQMRREAPRMGPRPAAELLAYARFADWGGGRRKSFDSRDGDLDRAAEAARDVLRQSFGQAEVLQRLYDQSLHRARDLRRQRAERNGQPPED